MTIRTAVAGVCTLLCLSAASVSGQGTVTPTDTTSALRVFIDCNYCDLDFLRTEMPWVDYMRDRADAHVHVLVTTEGTGGGGTAFTLNFIGLKQFAAMNDTLYYTSSSDDSQDAQRRGLTRMIQLGITPFVARTPLAQRLRVSVAAAAAGAAAATVPKLDPWHSWVFRLGFNASGNGESQSESRRYSGSVSASRTTEQWKSSLNVNSSQSLQSFTFPISETKDTTQTFFSRSSSVGGAITRSLGAKFSAGATGSVSTSTFGNTKVSASFKPAIEYDFFPYKDSNRRMLTLQYSIGVRAYEYADTTIYLKMQETLGQHSLSLSYYTQEQWGSLNIFSSKSEYLHDRSFSNTSIGGSADVRLFKGFGFNIYGDYGRVHDQLSLRKAGASQEEILLRQREIATNYRYSVGMGVSYRFGSIFNNVVNPRMGGGGGGFFFF